MKNNLKLLFNSLKKKLGFGEDKAKKELARVYKMLNGFDQKLDSERSNEKYDPMIKSELLSLRMKVLDLMGRIKLDDSHRLKIRFRRRYEK